MLLAPHLQRRIGGKRLGGFVDLALPGEHKARHDKRLRLGAALREPAIHQHLVGALLHTTGGIMGNLQA
jgi:hypothetical protein